MDDRSISTQPAEAPLKGGHGRGGPAEVGLDDPRALTILTTEHWSLLSARSLVYNEAFARAGMFLAFLSATLVALGLVATATGFSDAFLVVAAVLLALNLFVGLASLGRISAASTEDIRYLQGMNRLRHAYHEIVPGLEPYFVTGHHDDIASVLGMYGPAKGGTLRGVLHGFTTTPGMVGVICAAVAGVLTAVVAMLVTHGPVTAGLVGLATFGIVFLVLSALIVRQVVTFMGGTPGSFPSDEAGGR